MQKSNAGITIARILRFIVIFMILGSTISTLNLTICENWKFSEIILIFVSDKKNRIVVIYKKIRNSIFKDYFAMMVLPWILRKNQILDSKLFCKRYT